MDNEPHPEIGRPPPLGWDEDGAPRSAVFGDIYFQPGDGLAETRAVFLEGCGLPDAWSGRARFTVGELGFGTGLNIVALLDLWERTRAPGQRLNVFTVEAYPLSADEARRALAAFPELGALATTLLGRWPRPARGWHRLELPELAFTLDLAVADAAVALADWQGQADAWFLDGFAPSANPEMWSEEVLGLIAARSAPGARAATFTVAGAVRRGLAAHGFAVDRRPGHGRKRQRLEARLPGAPIRATPPGRIAVVGGGIAAAALVRAFGSAGADAAQIAPAGTPGASGNPAALVTPGLDAGEGPGGRLYAQALHRAVDIYVGAPGAILSQGVVQMEREPRDESRFDRIVTSSLFAPGKVGRLSPSEAADRLGELPGAGGLLLQEALTLRPAAALSAWTVSRRIEGQVGAIERSGDVWRLLDDEGQPVAEADIVCLAAGPGLRMLTDLPLGIVRGQCSWTDEVEAGLASAWGGYAADMGPGLLFGATHDRGDEGVDVRAADHRRNLETLAKGRPALAARLSGRPLSGAAALRVATPDRLPVCGAIAEGLYVLGGLGSRGFTTAPLLAEHIAALALGLPSPLPRSLAAAVSPARRALTRDAASTAERSNRRDRP